MSTSTLRTCPRSVQVAELVSMADWMAAAEASTHRMGGDLNHHNRQEDRRSFQQLRAELSTRTNR